MARNFPWPKAPDVRLSIPPAQLDGKSLSYTTFATGSKFPTLGVGRIKILKGTANQRHKVYLTFDLHTNNPSLDHLCEHAIALTQEHIDALRRDVSGQCKTDFECTHPFT